MNRPYDVVATGGIDVDLVLEVEAIPPEGEKVMGRLVGRMPGGTVGNFACAAARLGLRAASLAWVGDDHAGRMVIEDFERFGVDTSFVRAREGAETHFTVVLISPSGERSIVVVPMFVADYDADLARRAYGSARAVYMMAGQGEGFVSLADLARGEGAQVMVDVDPTVGAAAASAQRVLSRVDIACFNHGAFAAVAGRAPSLEAAWELLDYGPRVIVVTLGARGAMAVSREEQVVVPGRAVHVRDATGAGDTFNAALLLGVLGGDRLEETVRFANVAASIAVTGLGPRGHLADRAEVEAVLAGRQEAGA